MAAFFSLILGIRREEGERKAKTRFEFSWPQPNAVLVIWQLLIQFAYLQFVETNRDFP